jgi:hypothetical protein
VKPLFFRNRSLRTGGGDPFDVRRIAAQVGRREPHLGWLRRLPPHDLERIVHAVELDLASNRTRDSLLEHLARLHFDTTARARLMGDDDIPRLGDTDSARCAIEAVIFERRYGEKMLDAIGGDESMDDEWERANLYVESAFRRLGIVYTYVGSGHWLYESATTVVHLHHYPAPRILDLYAPLCPVPDEDPASLFTELLSENGGSLAGAFYGICSFGPSGDHLCSCSRLATEHLTGPDLVYALNSVVALADKYRGFGEDE